ncbi:MAG: response regulator [Gemmatimonadota bacterium]
MTLVNPSRDAAELPAAGSPPLVLVAEDNDDNRLIATAILRHSGYRVIEALSGADAVRIAQVDHPDLILMDVGLPDVDGWTATRTLKGDPRTRDIVIIAFTAHALPGDRIMAREAGCDGYLAKPVELARLVREVREALAARESGTDRLTS